MIQPQTCPVCRQPLTTETSAAPQCFPFCSSRCQQIDFFRWSDGKYAIVEDLSQRPDVLQELMEQLDGTEDDLGYDAEDEFQ